jgi:hypothetical protein
MTKRYLSVMQIMQRMVILDETFQDQSKAEAKEKGEKICQSWVLKPWEDKEADKCGFEVELKQAKLEDAGDEIIAVFNMMLCFKNDGTLWVSVVVDRIVLNQNVGGLEVCAFGDIVHELGNHLSDLAAQATDNLYRSVVKKETKPD